MRRRRRLIISSSRAFFHKARVTATATTTTTPPPLASGVQRIVIKIKNCRRRGESEAQPDSYKCGGLQSTSETHLVSLRARPNQPTSLCDLANVNCTCSNCKTFLIIQMFILCAPFGAAATGRERENRPPIFWPPAPKRTTAPPTTTTSPRWQEAL